MKVCSYCGQTGIKMTKEHLWPTSLHRRLEEQSKEKHQFYLSKINKYIDSEPQIKDVCASCNNGVLSELDAYICNLWDSYFHRIIERGEYVEFDCDYNLLLRWLLKLCYNSARVHESDSSHLVKCTEYIMGNGICPDNVSMHLQLSHPSYFNKEQRANIMAQQEVTPDRYEPRINRVGHFGYVTRNRMGRLTRAIHIQSYVFFVHLFPDSVSKVEQMSNVIDFEFQMPHAVKMNESDNLYSIKCEGLDSLKSLVAHFNSKGMPPID